MLEYQLHTEKGILEIHPIAPLGSRDFVEMTEIVTRYLSHNSHLQGILIHSCDMPGWEDFAELIHHVHFLGDHQQRIRRVAAVANRPLGSIGKAIEKHFASATVRQFADDLLTEARLWLESSQPQFQRA